MSILDCLQWPCSSLMRTRLGEAVPPWKTCWQQHFPYPIWGLHHLPQISTQQPSYQSLYELRNKVYAHPFFSCWILHWPYKISFLSEHVTDIKAPVTPSSLFRHFCPSLPNPISHHSLYDFRKKVIKSHNKEQCPYLGEKKSFKQN